MADREQIQQQIEAAQKLFNSYYKIGSFNLAELYKDKLIKLYKELNKYDKENN